MYLENDENAYELGEVAGCQTCGEDTRDLEIVGSLARCKECEQRHHKTMERADEYLHAPWNPFDNDYEEDPFETMGN
jgi:hypothetical protein